MTGAATGESGYWGKHGPEFLDRRLALYRDPQRMVLGAGTFRLFSQTLITAGPVDRVQLTIFPVVIPRATSSSRQERA